MPAQIWVARNWAKLAHNNGKIARKYVEDARKPDLN